MGNIKLYPPFIDAFPIHSPSKIEEVSQICCVFDVAKFKKMVCHCVMFGVWK